MSRIGTVGGKHIARYLVKWQINPPGLTKETEVKPSKLTDEVNWIVVCGGEHIQIEPIYEQIQNRQ